MKEIGEMIFSLLKDLFSLWLEILGAIISYIPKLVILVLWVILGIIILPCVFVAGNLYPKWTEWGEKL